MFMFGAASRFNIKARFDIQKSNFPVHPSHGFNEDRPKTTFLLQFLPVHPLLD